MGNNPAPPNGKQARQESVTLRVHPELRELVLEASQALARLDANRLEELALSCQALNRELIPAKAEDRAALAKQARDARADMQVFARVLEATQANVNVMNRLRELCGNRLEYSEPQVRGYLQTELKHGDN